MNYFSIILFLNIILVPLCESKIYDIEFIHTNYYYNSSNCNNTPNIIEIINTNKCNNTLNMCFNIDNHSIYKTCKEQHNIISNQSTNTINVLLTILILLIIFILYKIGCESCVDDYCNNLKNRIESFFGCNQVIPYSEYNHL